MQATVFVFVTLKVRVCCTADTVKELLVLPGTTVAIFNPSQIMSYVVLVFDLFSNFTVAVLFVTQGCVVVFVETGSSLHELINNKTSKITKSRTYFIFHLLKLFLKNEFGKTKLCFLITKLCTIT